MVRELDGVLEHQEDETEVFESPLDLGFPSGLSLHCMYSRDQIFAGLGHWTPEKINVHGGREGVLYLRKKNLDVFFITLNKSKTHFSPSTMYNNYTISERLFHWQSQSTTSASSPTGSRSSVAVIIHGRDMAVRGHFRLRLPDPVPFLGRNRENFGRWFLGEAISSPVRQNLSRISPNNRPIYAVYKGKSGGGSGKWTGVGRRVGGDPVRSRTPPGVQVLRHRQ